jgi:hypothetical protein
MKLLFPVNAHFFEVCFFSTTGRSLFSLGISGKYNGGIKYTQAIYKEKIPALFKCRDIDGKTVLISSLLFLCLD